MYICSLGSTSYITDDKANITQYDAYLPYGELLVDEHSSSEDLPYKFNGKPRQTLDNYPKAFIYYASGSKQAKQIYQYDLQKSKINPIFNPSYQRIRKYVYR